MTDMKIQNTKNLGVQLSCDPFFLMINKAVPDKGMSAGQTVYFVNVNERTGDKDKPFTKICTFYLSETEYKIWL